MVKGIIFDCYGVLVHGSLQYLRSLAPDRNGLLAFNDLTHAADQGYVSQAEYIEQASQLLGKSKHEIHDIIVGREMRNQQMVDYVTELHSKFKVAILSNIGRGSIHRLFSDVELSGLFDAVILSSEVGMTKPGIEIYEYAADRLSLSTDMCVMVDDTSVNVEGAQMAGMQGILFKDMEQVKRDIEQLVGNLYA